MLNQELALDLFETFKIIFKKIMPKTTYLKTNFFVPPTHLAFNFSNYKSFILCFWGRSKRYFFIIIKQHKNYIMYFITQINKIRDRELIENIGENLSENTGTRKNAWVSLSKNTCGNTDTYKKHVGDIYRKCMREILSKKMLWNIKKCYFIEKKIKDICTKQKIFIKTNVIN